MADVKLKSGKYTVRNIAPGVRGFHDHNDGYLEIEPGSSATGVVFTVGEFESALATKAFEITAGDAPASDDDGQADGGAKALEDMTTAELQAVMQAEGIAEADVKGTAANGNVKNSDRVTAIRAKRAGEGSTPPAGDTLDGMSDDDLRATVKALTGDEPAADADRDTLLKLARGEA